MIAPNNILLYMSDKVDIFKNPNKITALQISERPFNLAS